MKDQTNVAVFRDDHDCFKRFAAKQKRSMKDIFHEWIEKYITGVNKDEVV